MGLLEYVHLSGKCCPCWLCLDWSNIFSKTNNYGQIDLIRRIIWSDWFNETDVYTPLHTSGVRSLVRYVLSLLVTWISHINLTKRIYTLLHFTGVCTFVRYVCSCWLHGLVKLVSWDRYTLFRPTGVLTLVRYVMFLLFHVDRLNSFNETDMVRLI